jgi:GNAT superfamily N-acetyltransferase
VRHEAEHNLLLGLVGGLAANPAPNPAPYLALLEDGAAVVAVAVRTTRFLVLSRIAPHLAPAALAALVADLAAGGGTGTAGDPLAALPGVNGPPALALDFAARWRAAGGPPFQRTMATRIYQLDAVTPVPDVPGALRPATAADAGLVAAWLGAFQRDIGDAPSADVARDAARSIAAGGLHLWQPAPSGAPVSMANATGATPNGIRINMVYTPPESRRRGYASAAVAALSQAMLDAGRRHCFLYTDLGNPTPNRIYQTIGYRPVADADSYRFATPTEPA